MVWRLNLALMYLLFGLQWEVGVVSTYPLCFPNLCPDSGASLSRKASYKACDHFFQNYYFICKLCLLGIISFLVIGAAFCPLRCSKGNVLLWQIGYICVPLLIKIISRYIFFSNRGGLWFFTLCSPLFHGWFNQREHKLEAVWLPVAGENCAAEYGDGVFYDRQSEAGTAYFA